MSISIIGAVVEVGRCGFSRPFALVMWSIIFLIGMFVFFFMTDEKL